MEEDKGWLRSAGAFVRNVASKDERFALLAAKFGDKAAAREIFAQIVDHWDPEVWGDRQTFEKAKHWAEN